MKYKIIFLFIILFFSPLFGEERSFTMGKTIQQIDKIEPIEYVGTFSEVKLPVESITITPKIHNVKKGDLVTFTYDIQNLQDDVYVVSWSGLSGRKYKKRFIINTSNLTEGKSYIIYAQRNKGKRAKAILYIKKKSQLSAKIKYQSYIKADKKNITAGSLITFSSRVSPSLSQVKYQFIYGDGSNSGWLSTAQSSHKYSKADKYYAYVKAKHYNPLLGSSIGEGNRDIKIIRSSKVTINVKSKPIPINYKLSMSASFINIEEGERISFSSSLKPTNKDVQYKFDFGNGETTKWSAKSSYSIHYIRKGTYYPSVGARVGKNEIAKQSIKIKVKAKKTVDIKLEEPIKGEPLKPVNPETKDFIVTFPGGSITLDVGNLTILGVGILAILIVLRNVFTLLRELFEKPQNDKLDLPKTLNKFKLKAINQDNIVYKIEMEPTTQSLEVRLIPIRDNGEHKIEGEERK